MSLSIEYHESHLDLIAGDWLRPGVHLTFTDPWGNSWQVMSGTKPEHGELGGFECGARSPGEGYTVQAGMNVWTFDHPGGGMTFLRWTEEPEPPPEPEPPDPEPPDPEPPPEPPVDEIEVKVGHVYSAVLDGETIKWYDGIADNAVWFHRGWVLPGCRLWLPKEEPARPCLAAWLADLRDRVDRLERMILGISRNA